MKLFNFSALVEQMYSQFFMSKGFPMHVSAGNKKYLRWEESVKADAYKGGRRLAHGVVSVGVETHVLLLYGNKAVFWPCVWHGLLILRNHLPPLWRGAWNPFYLMRRCLNGTRAAHRYH